VGQDRTDSICSLSFQYFTLFFRRRSYEGPPLHVSFFEMFRKRKQRASQAAAAAGAAGVAYAPHTLLELSTQLLLWFKNCRFLSWDTIEHPPVFRHAKSARTPKLCGPKDVGPISKCQFRASSNGGAQRHLVSAPWRVAAIPKAS
jgi:hypothetical protein